MSSENTDEQVTAVESSIAMILAKLAQLNRRFEEPMYSTPKSEDVNVLPSVSNPASKTSPLSPRKHDLPPVPPKKLHTPSSCVKPVNPTKFLGGRTKGHVFLNLCNLYFVLTPNQFADDQVKIMWAFSFMKGEQASHFVDQKMQMYDVVGSLTYAMWQEFVQEFIANFCPKNEVQTSQTELETMTSSKGHALSTSMLTLSKRPWTRRMISRAHTSSSNFVKA
jgi:hypothetical protein